MIPIPPQALLLVVKMLGLAVSGIRMIPELRARYDAYSSAVQAMIDEGRGPTDDEWAELLSETAALTDRIAVALQHRRDREEEIAGLTTIKKLIDANAPDPSAPPEGAAREEGPA